MTDVEIRSYNPADLEAIQKIHNDNKLDFKFPNLNSLLFPVHKILEVDGEVKASYALRAVMEVNLWLDKTNWATSVQKWDVIKALDHSATSAALDIGLDGITCFLPPGYERFGRRISDKKDGLGFRADRPGWSGFSKHAGDIR
jgi:hypothetical protein